VAADAAEAALASFIPVTNGDKGDLTISNNGATYTLDSGVVSTAKVADQAITIDKVHSRLGVVLNSVSDILALNIPAHVKSVYLLGYATPGDGGAHKRKRVTSAPTWGSFRSLDRFLPNETTDATNGGYWDVDEWEPNEMMFGGISTNTNAQQTSAITAMLNYAAANTKTATIVTAHTITSTLTIPEHTTLKFAKRGYSGSGAVLDKGFNGDMIIMSNGSKLVSPALRGQATNWTGRGVVINSGSDQRIEDPFMIDMQSYCLEFTADGAGIRFRMDGGLIQSATGYAVRMPASEATTTGFRHFRGVHTGGTPFIDFRNGNYTIVDDCVCTDLNWGNTTTGRTKVLNSRIATTAGVLLFGTEHTFIGNTLATAITIGSGATRCVVTGNISNGLTNNSGNATNVIGNNVS
jgi:hypothetical protein